MQWILTELSRLPLGGKIHFSIPRILTEAELLSEKADESLLELLLTMIIYARYGPEFDRQKLRMLCFKG